MIGKCCNGSSIIAHLLVLAGMYVLTWGLIGSCDLKVVLSSPVFWGLFLLGAARCISLSHKKK